MNHFERRLRKLEAIASGYEEKPWKSVIVDVGESKEEVFKREGIGPNDNVIVRVIVAPRPCAPLEAEQ